jgi:queuine tRNA-ribosyltransferase
MRQNPFDCVHPTRIARHPIDENCPCYTCQNFSQAYLHHLLKAKELLIFQLLTLHNVTFMNRFMAKIRESIAHSE